MAKPEPAPQPEPQHTLTVLMSPQELGRRLMMLALKYAPEIDAAKQEAERESQSSE